ncbi:TadE/TadG family type IV pilus assembly protein [Castellaniella sp.]|uniref:TadE/TadG family type IV pilus assembly protein n=1 Tax=Castellaniella sp. TaxID=1955812 RepID=UPI003C73B06C
MKARPSVFRRLLRNQRGAIAISFAVSFLTMLGGTLFSIDMVRYNTTQSRMQNALDAAVISAGRKLAVYTPTEGSADEDPWKADAYQYFRSNMPPNFFGSDVPTDSIDIQYLEETTQDGKFRTAQRLRMIVSGTLPLLSSGYMNETSMNLYASNWAVRRVRSDLELVLALDNTGSMDFDSPTRMSQLKISAKQLVETVMRAGEAGVGEDGKSGVYVGIVPFTEAVNVKNISSAKTWLNKYPAQQNYLDNLWNGCVSEPPGDWSKTNKLPARALTPSAGFLPLQAVYAEDFVPLFLTQLPGFGKKIDELRVGDVVPGSIHLQKTGDPKKLGYSEPSSNVATRDRRITASIQSKDSSEDLHTSGEDDKIRALLARETGTCPTSRVKFLSQEETDLNSAIESMSSNGGTNVPMGLIWAWRMLDPAWRGTEGWGSATLPRDPAAGSLNKVIVLLSDGDNDPGDSEKRANSATAAFTLAYDYSYQTISRVIPGECIRWNGSHTKCQAWAQQTYEPNPVRQSGTRLADPDTRPVPRFDQCPVTGIRSRDPDSVDPGNYDDSCKSNRTDIGYLTSGTIPSDAITGTALNNYMTALCQNVKDTGIRVYTLTLGTSVSSGAKTLMKNCATDPEKTYFDVSNAANLSAAFQEIAGALTELRLTPPPSGT